MMKNKLFVIINVSGMGVAIACCIVVYLAFQYDKTFDAIHENKEQIYRVSAVREFGNNMARYGYASLPLGEVVDKTFPDVDRSARYLHSQSNFKIENELFTANLTYVDLEFFQMFSFYFKSGNVDNLNDKTSLLISEEMAIRLFGSIAEALGKTITQVYGDELKELKVAAIFAEPPMNSSFFKKEGSAYINFENYKDEFSQVRSDDWRKECTLFVQINDLSRVSAVHQQLQGYIENNNKVRKDFQIAEFVLDPFSSMAADDRADAVQASTWAAPPLSAIVGAMVMGTLILLIACFNLTNTAIATSSKRLKEIGIRKVMGSKRTQLIVQFIGETTAICFFALLLGIGLADLLIEGWNVMTMDMLRLSHNYLNNPIFLLFLISLLIFTGIVAGSYPAFYISKFKPVTILKGKIKFGGTNYFTRVLLGLQFTICLIAIVSAIGFFQNAMYQREYDLGFDIRGSLIAWVNNENEFETYRNALAANPEIISMAGASSSIFTNRQHEGVKHESREVEVDIISVGENYLQTMDLKLLKGRDFIKDSKTDQQESIIITQKMADLFGWSNPIGKEVTWRDSTKLFVIGVVQDVYTMGLWREMEPMMIRYIPPAEYSQIIVSTKGEDVASVNVFMHEQWKKTFPNRLYNGRMLVSDLHEVLDLNMNITYMYGFLGLIALVLSATGLFTLVSLNIIKRMKEIGVRKVLGASMVNITRILNTEFFIILSLACLLGSIASFNWCNIIMATIWKYYQGVNILTFIMAITLLFAVSFLVIGYKVLTVATMNPVKTLRDE
jgi:ABC-type antimicrobial peptide transport system permease subunit